MPKADSDVLPVEIVKASLLPVLREENSRDGVGAGRGCARRWKLFGADDDEHCGIPQPKRCSSLSFSGGLLKKPKPPRIFIENPGLGMPQNTSAAIADRWVDYKRAVRTGVNRIRILESNESRQQRTLQAEMRKDESYWLAVARQRGGASVKVHWQPRPSGDYTVMQARVAVG